MTDLTPITALGAPAPRSGCYGALTLAENPSCALASLALRRGALVPSPLGLELPGPGEWAAGTDLSAFWMGPDQWMMEAPGRAEEDFARALKPLAPGASVTEQTDGWVIFEITSAQGAEPVLRLLEKLVDLDPDRFAPGKATRTGLEHMSVFLIRRAPERLAVLGMRSAAGSLWHALATAAARLAGPGQ